jgi:hypothetical protein
MTAVEWLASGSNQTMLIPGVELHVKECGFLKKKVVFLERKTEAIADHTVSISSKYKGLVKQTKRQRLRASPCKE